MVLRSLPAVGVVLLALVWCAAAGAAPLRVRAPGVVSGGSLVVVRGRAPARSLVLLRRRGFGVVARARSGGAGRGFALRWRAPRRRVVVALRVVATRSGRVIGESRVLRVAVTPTSVVRASRVVAAPPAGAAGTLRYRGRAGVRPGEFVAADVGEETPNGLLARVVAVRLSGADTVARVVPASLLEAVPSGSLHAGGPAVGAGIEVKPRSFEGPLSCSGIGDGDGDVSGALDVSLQPRLDVAWSGGAVRTARASATVRGRVRLAVQVSGSGECKLDEADLGEWTWPPLRAFVGPVPVVIVPKTNLYVSAEASMNGGAWVAIDGRASATAGLSWDGSDVHPIGAFSHAFSWDPPRFGGPAVLGARLIPAITFLLYGEAGPRFDISTGLRFSATPGARPAWTLSAPVDLRAGLVLPSWSGLTIPKQTAFSRTFPLASGGGVEPGSPGAGSSSPPGSGSGGSPGSAPSPGSARGRERARITWDTPATDVDLHVWDAAGHHAWFRDPTAIPDGTLSEDDRYGFGPESFDDASPGSRALTYGLCYFDDTGAGPTRVSVRLTDPDGSVRASTITLAREGDHRVIGSPAAGAPPEGWCRP